MACANVARPMRLRAWTSGTSTVSFTAVGIRAAGARRRLCRLSRDRYGGRRRSPAFAQPVHFQSGPRSEEHTSELQSLRHLVCRLLLEKKKKITERKPHIQA